MESRPLARKQQILMNEQFVFRSHMPASADAVYRFHAQADALARLTPPWEHATVYEQTGGIEDLGSRVKIRLKIGPLQQTWVAEHTACKPGRMFRDTMVSGPFKKWEHTHLFEPDGANASWLEDRVEYEMPLGWLGRIFGGAYTRRRLARMFAWRHEVTAKALANSAGPAAKAEAEEVR
jgi:ligand-binding SRPBCC domain-containing protein